MMNGTDPANVSLCFDVHWVYRGADNSEVACFDIAKLYADRIVEYHLRQSIDHIWSESFDDGDIDYAAIIKVVQAANGQSPHIVLEQAVESGTPQTMSTVEAFKKSVSYTRALFG
jgi:inosose dehydratase